MIDDYSRLVYLAHQTKCEIPNSLVRYIPRGKTLNLIASQGLISTEKTLDLQRGLLQNQYKQGEQLGEGNVAEYRNLIAEMTLDSILDYELTTSEFLEICSLTNQFRKSTRNSLLGELTSTLDDMSEAEEIPKFVSGFMPFDIVVDGMYQAIVTLGMKTGDGKTTFGVTLWCMLRKHNLVDEIWYFNAEIPHSLMLSKIKRGAEFHDVKFTNKDVLFSSSSRAQDILEKIEENPNPARVIIYDGPDVTVPGDGDSKLSGIEGEYQNLVKIKLMSKFVVVTSQIKRDAKWPYKVTDLSDSSSKEKYSDIVLFGKKKSQFSTDPGFESNGLNPRDLRGFNGALLYTGKNRFGPPNQMISYLQNYVNLSYNISPIEWQRFFEDFGSVPDYVLDYYADDIPDAVLSFAEKHGGI